MVNTAFNACAEPDPLQQPASVDVTRDQATPLTTLDASQQAAQLQSWLFMSAKLESSYAGAKLAAAAAIEQRRAELSADEADIADARVRFEAERLIAFYEELMAPHVLILLHAVRGSDIDGFEIGGLCDCIFSAAISYA